VISFVGLYALQGIATILAHITFLYHITKLSDIQILISLIFRYHKYTLQ